MMTKRTNKSKTAKEKVIHDQQTAEADQKNEINSRNLLPEVNLET